MFASRYNAFRLLRNLCVFTLSTIFLASCAHAQMLTNPGFEGNFTALLAPVPDAKAQVTGEVAPGWTDNTSWTTTTIHYAKDTSVFHSGASSQRVEAVSGFVQFAQGISFPAAGTYQASLWIKAKTPTWVSVSLRQADAPYIGYAGQPVKIGMGWQQVSVNGVVPTGSAVLLVNIGSDQGIKSPGAVLWLDDATLSPISPAQTLSPPKTAVPPSYFGMNANHMHDPPGYDWPALSFGTFRSWDSGVIWPKVEPARGLYNWTVMDKDVANARRHSAQFLFTLGLTPQWAAPSQPNTYAGVANVPDNINDYKVFVSTVANRYKGRIQSYEVWNEPDNSQFCTGTPAQVARLEGSLAQAVRPADPAARICTPPISATALGSVQWFDAYLAAGGGRQADVISYHLYNDPAEADIASIKIIRSVLASYGLDKKPIWNTEAGLLSAGHTDQDGAAHVARVALIDWAAGFDRFCWYAYDNGPLYVSLDVISPNGKTRDPSMLASSGVAYREVRNWLVGSRMLSCKSDARGIWTARLTRADGRSAWVVWSTEGTCAFNVPSSWHIKTRRDLAGNVTPVLGSISVTGSPVLLQSQSIRY